MDYKNEFEGIIEAVKSEMRAQKSALQNEENSVRDAEGFEKAQNAAPKEGDGAAAGASQDEQSFVSQEEGLLRGDSLNGGQNSGSQAAHLRAVSDKILSTARDEHLRAADGGADDGRLRDGEAAGGNFKISADAADEIYERLGSDIDVPPFAQASAQNFTQNSAQSSKNSSPQNFTNDPPRSSQNSAQSAAENSMPAPSSENVAVQDLASEFEEASESFDLAFKEFHEIESPQNSSLFGSKANALGAEGEQASSASPQLSSASGARFSSQISSTSRADARAQILGACEACADGANEISSEAEFLSALKERILVLFEGLNAFDQGDIEARVELNLKFMEFLLASIDDRLEHLSKR